MRKYERIVEIYTRKGGIRTSNDAFISKGWLRGKYLKYNIQLF